MASTLVLSRQPDVFQRIVGYLSGTYTASSDANTASGQGTPASITNPNGIQNLGTSGAVLASGVLTITPGFIPTYVKVINVTDRLTQEWFKGMNVGDFLETAANGDKTLETDDKLTISATTGVISVLADGGAITDNDTVVWVVEG